VAVASRLHRRMPWQLQNRHDWRRGHKQRHAAAKQALAALQNWL